MKITNTNLNRIMKIEDLSKRKSKLQEMALSIGWHGDIWQKAMDEINRLNSMGVQTALEKELAKN